MAVVAKIATLELTGATGSRKWVATAASQDTAAGSSVTVTVTITTTGASPPVQADTLDLLIFVDNHSLGGTTADVKSFSLTPGSASQNVSFFFTANGNSGGGNRCGLLRMQIHAVKNTGLGTSQYDVNSDNAGTETLPTGFSLGQVDQGWIRGTTTATLKVAHTAIGNTDTDTYAYPDTVFMRTGLAAGAFFASSGQTASITEKVGTVLSSSRGTTADGQTSYDLTFTNGIDTAFPAGSSSQTAQITLSNSSLAASTPWTDIGTSPTQTLTVNPDVTIGTVTNNDSGGTAHVYNRGDSPSGSVSITNARGVGFTPKGWHTIKSIDTGGGVEETVVSDQASTSTKTWSFSFGSSGNVAPTTSAGSAKKLRWRDTTTQGGTTNSSNSPTPANTGTYGFLSSLYNFAVHLQVNNNTLAPALNVTKRLISDLGFFSSKITDINGNAVNGAQGVLSLQDDQSLTSAVVSSTLTTAAQNGNNGYVPLQTWSSSLPGGGWDLFPSTQFTKNGNTTNTSRKGSVSYDFTLLAPNPSFRLIAGAGAATSSYDNDHWHPGDPLLTGLALVDLTNDLILTPDASPAPSMLIGRFNVTLGRAEYLASDLTWKAVTGNTIYEWPLTASPGDANVFIYTFTGANTAGWNEADLFIVGKCYYNGTPYTGPGQLEALQPGINTHQAYAFDPTGLFR